MHSPIDFDFYSQLEKGLFMKKLTYQELMIECETGCSYHHYGEDYPLTYPEMASISDMLITYAQFEKQRRAREQRHSPIFLLAFSRV